MGLEFSLLEGLKFVEIRDSSRLFLEIHLRLRFASFHAIIHYKLFGINQLDQCYSMWEPSPILQIEARASCLILRLFNFWSSKYLIDVNIENAIYSFSRIHIIPFLVTLTILRQGQVINKVQYPH